MGSLRRIAPIFPVRDLEVAFAHYRSLGFQVRAYHLGGYGIATRDEVEIHLGVAPDDRLGTGSAYLFVADADALAAQWRAAGAQVHDPEDTPWGQHEGVMVDPEGNVIRFGSPVPGGA